MGGQTDSQVTKSREFHALLWTCDNLRRFAFGGERAKNLRRLAYEFELDFNASGRPNETHGERRSKTCIDLQVCLVRASGLRFPDDYTFNRFKL